MQEIKEIQSQAYAAGQPWTREFQGRVFNQIVVKGGFNLLTGATALANVFTDPAAKLFGSYEIIQDETPLLTLTMQQFFWLCAIVNGEPGMLRQPDEIAAATADVAELYGVLDLVKLCGPFAMIDARSSKVFTRGVFGAAAAYSDVANWTTPTGTVRQSVRTTARVPQAREGFAYLRPQIFRQDQDIGSVAGDLPYTIRFEQDVYLPGIMLITNDVSLGGTTSNDDAELARSDEIVRSIRVEAQTRELNGEIYRSSWGLARAQTWASSAFAGRDVSDISGDNRSDPLCKKPHGVVWIPTVDERNSRANGAALFRRGDALTFHIDTLSTVENEYGTGAAGAGDILHYCVPAFVPVTVADDARVPGDVNTLAVVGDRSGRDVRRGRRVGVR